MMTRRLAGSLSAWTACVLLSVGVTACGGEPTRPKTPDGVIVDDGGKQKAPQAEAEIQLFGMSPGRINRLDSNRRRGKLFALRGEKVADANGEMETHWTWVDCPFEVEYNIQRHPRQTADLRVTSVSELNASLPLSAGKFGARLQKGSEFQFKYAIVASYEPAAERDIVLPREHPGCAEATHFVSTLSIGAVTWRDISSHTAAAKGGTEGVEVEAGIAGETSWESFSGTINSCFDEQVDAEALDVECRSPLSVVLEPLRDRNWCPEGDGECELRRMSQINPRICQGTSPHPLCTPGKQPTIPQTGVATMRSPEVCDPLFPEGSGGLSIFASTMEEALTQARTGRMGTYGYNDRDPFLLGGLLKEGHTFSRTFQAQAGDEFAAVVVGDQDARDLGLAVEGVASGNDSSTGRQSQLFFKADRSGELRVNVSGTSIGSDQGAFVSLVLMRKGGDDYSRCKAQEIVRTGFDYVQRFLEHSEAAAFNGEYWGFYAGTLRGEKPTDRFVTDRFELSRGKTWAFGIASDEGRDVDIVLAADDLEEPLVDKEEDHQPYVRHDAGKAVPGQVGIVLHGAEPVLFAGGVLDQGSSMEGAQACDSSDYSDLQIGSRIVLGRHSEVNGDTNWAESMAPHVGKTAAITERLGQDKSGCQLVKVDADEGEFVWRLRDAKPVLGPQLPSSGRAVGAGKWLLSKHRDRIYVWRADRGVAAEFVDGSNGWWRFKKGKTVSTVYSSGSTAGDRAFTVTPWEVMEAGTRRPEGTTYRSGAQTVTIKGSTVTVATHDGLVTFGADGSIKFRTRDGTTKRM